VSQLRFVKQCSFATRREGRFAELDFGAEGGTLGEKVAGETPVIGVAGKDLEEGLGETPKSSVVGQVVEVPILDEGGAVATLPIEHGAVELVDARVILLSSTCSSGSSPATTSPGANVAVDMADDNSLTGQVHWPTVLAGARAPGDHF
jgi:hypothetical protein